jgi:hypothetical protein
VRRSAASLVNPAETSVNRCVVHGLMCIARCSGIRARPRGHR